MNLGSLVFGVLNATIFGTTNYKEACCSNGICFNNISPFDNLPLPDCPDDLSPQFKLYTRHNQDVPAALTRNQTPAIFNETKETIFIVHGYMPYLTDLRNPRWLPRLIENLLNRSDSQVVTLHWSEGSHELFYPKSASNTRSIGVELSLVFRSLVGDNGAKRKRIWCIGFSLGAHVCGHAGRRFKIGRITGLDPAGPFFENKPVEIGLGQDCADFVDVWHTHGKRTIVPNLGTMRPLGHVDFYPNAGGSQPGCRLKDMFKFKHLRSKIMSRFRGRRAVDLLPDCSHLRALDLFGESLSSDCQFLASYQCSNFEHMPGSCASCGRHICQIMGPNSKSVPGRGMFYLQTNAHPPYCRRHQEYTPT